MTDLHELSALEQASAVRGRQVSAVELVHHHLDRVGVHDSAVGAFVTLTADSALAAAHRADQLLAATPAGAALPPLLGVPTAVKDLNAVAGVPMKLGSAAFTDLVPDWDDHVVSLLRSAGMISLGKTATPELGLPCYTEPEPQAGPVARTPWDLSRSAGGSSGGAGAAVAAGLVSLAQGSDGGGSIRIPASACGLVGLKPSRGRVSSGPRGAEVTGLGVIGPLARTVADAAAFLDAVARPQVGDATWAPPLPAGETFLAASRRSPGRLRIGRSVANIADAPVDPAVVAVWEQASKLLAELGHTVEDVPAPAFGPVYDEFFVLWSVSAATAPVPPGREPLLRPLTRWLRAQGRAHSGPAFVAALSTLQQTTRRHLVDTAGYHVVLTPTLAQLPAPVGSLRDDADPAADFDAQTRFTPFTAVVNLTGQPAISLPLGTAAGDGPAGLPVGVQLVGRPAGETVLLALAAQLEAAAPWSGRQPPIR